MSEFKPHRWANKDVTWWRDSWRLDLIQNFKVPLPYIQVGLYAGDGEVIDGGTCCQVRLRQLDNTSLNQAGDMFPLTDLTVVEPYVLVDGYIAGIMLAQWLMRGLNITRDDQVRQRWGELMIRLGTKEAADSVRPSTDLIAGLFKK